LKISKQKINNSEKKEMSLEKVVVHNIDIHNSDDILP